MNHQSTPISPREAEVLHLIAHEHSSKEIASKLFVSYETVNSHRKNMMDKLGVKNTAGLVRVAFERGLMHVRQVAYIMLLLATTHLSAQTPDFHVEGEKHVLFGDQLSGAGVKLIWDGSTGSMRAGQVFNDLGDESTYWNSSNIGSNSAAFGRNNLSSGLRAMAWGEDNISCEFVATAWGENSKATAYAATAWGQTNEAAGAESTAWGAENIASGRRSTVWGFRNKSQSLFETVLGRYADTLSTSAENSWQSRDQLFVVGNGTSITNRQNALTVLKEGKIGIKTNQPNTDLHIKQIANSEFNGIRLESANSNNHWTTFYNPANNYAFYYNSSAAAAISPNGNYIDLVPFRENDTSTKSNLKILDDIQKLKPMLAVTNDKRKISLKWTLEMESLSQVFPEITPEVNGQRGVIYDYFGVIAIKAIQEQQEIIETQQLENKELEEKVNTLENRLTQLEILMADKL